MRVEVERDSPLPVPPADEAKETAEGEEVRVGASSTRRFVNFFFRPWIVSPPNPPPAAVLVGSGEFARREKAPAVLANETWLLFHRDLSTPRIDSTGDTGRVDEVMKLVDGVTLP